MTMLKKKWLVECQGAKITFSTAWQARRAFMKLQSQGLSPEYPVEL